MNNERKLSKQDFKNIKLAVRYYDEMLSKKYWEHRRTCSFDQATNLDKPLLEKEYEELSEIDDLLTKLEQ